jgi:hypothetical protein
MKTLICVSYLILGTALWAQQTYTGNLLLYNGKGQVVDNQSKSFTANIGPFGWLTPGAIYGGALSNWSYTSPSSGAILITGTLKLYDSQGKLVASQSQSFSTDLSDINWLTNGQAYWGTIQNWSYTAPRSSPVPRLPSKPSNPVTDCPNLLFSDSFNQGEVELQSELSQSGPITGKVKWITHRADGIDWGDAKWATVGDKTAFDDTAGYLQLTITNHQKGLNLGGDGNWWTGGLSTLAYANGGADSNGNPTGFKVKPPFYVEIACIMPALAPTDRPNVAAFWPSVSLYTDPALTSANGYSEELDMFECYSSDYTAPVFSWHTWSSDGRQTAAHGSSFSHGAFPDLSKDWHIYGLWVDTTSMTWYLDGRVVFTAPTVGANLPYYVVIAAQTMKPNRDDAGAIGASPSLAYPMDIAYIGVWAQ